MANKNTYIQLFKLLGFSTQIFEKAETILNENFMEKYLSETNERFPYYPIIPTLKNDVDLASIKHNFKIETNIIQLQRICVYEYFIIDIENQNKLTLKIGPSSILMNFSFEKFRNELIQNKAFTSIVTTKKSIFPETAISMAIIITSEKQTPFSFSTISSFEDLYDFIFDRTNFKRTVFETETLDNKNLLPEHYNKENKKIYNFIENFNPQKLEEIADIIPGRSPARWETNEIEGIPLLSIGSIKNGEIVKCTKFVNENAVSNYSRQLLEEGDILISRTFGQNKICVVKEKDLPAIASGFLIIVRPLNITDINLYDYLSSNAGELIFKKQLTNIATGSTIPNISISSLKNIKIPTVNKKNVDSFEKEYNSTFEEIKDIATSALNRISESVLEEQILENLLKAGWKKEDISKTERIKYNDRYLIPDITLEDNGSILAFIEVKQSSLNINDKIAQIKAIQKQHNALAIISLGDYFEVYKKVKEQFIVYKFASAPTKTDLIKIIKEEN